jgi:hypothetical protein
MGNGRKMVPNLLRQHGVAAMPRNFISWETMIDSNIKSKLWLLKKNPLPATSWKLEGLILTSKNDNSHQRYSYQQQESIIYRFLVRDKNSLHSEGSNKMKAIT